MRHTLSAGAVAAHSGGVRTAAASARLVTPTRLLNRLAPGVCAAAGIAVDLPAIAAAADDDLGAAAGAQKKTARPRLGPPAGADKAWTRAFPGRIIVLHSCPARCGARRRCKTCPLCAAPCLPPKSGRLSTPCRGGRCHLTSSPKHPAAQSGQPSSALGRLWSGLSPLPPSAHRAHDHQKQPWAPSMRGFQPPPTRPAVRASKSGRSGNYMGA